MVTRVFIGAGAGFAGDRSDAAAPVVDVFAHAAGSRFLIYETLAERTLALCQIERRKDSARGYSPALERMLSPILSCADFLQKPFSMSRLIDTITQATGRSPGAAVEDHGCT